METPDAGAGFKPEAASADAAERFFALLKTFGAAGAGTLSDWSAVATPLAAQFEQWLRVAQSPAAALGTAAGFAPGAIPAALRAAGLAAPAWAFAPLPLGAAAAGGNDAQRALELIARLGQLQAQLAAHWGEIARSAAQRFVARVGSGTVAPGGAEQALKLYELWVDCAEEAYAATVHRNDFAHLQAQIANTSTALLIEQRRHAEALARALGLPTRGELDALRAEVRELRQRLETSAQPARPRPRGPPGGAAPGSPAGRARKGAAGKRTRARARRR